jgi:hypothetical protein
MTLENTFRTKNNLGKNAFALVFASILLASLGVSANQAYAMGQAPSTCSNRYDGTITAMKIIVGHRTYDPIAHPGTTFQLRNDKSYTVTFTIHTPSQNSQNNTLVGDTWYDTSAPGYQLGKCITGTGPNQDVTVTVTETHPGNRAPQTTQNVSWKTLLPGETTFSIKWINPSV